MKRTLGMRRLPLAVIGAAALLAVGGIAYAAIPDSGAVIHACYVKSSGALRAIDTELGQSCKANELPLAVYSKNGADALFLDEAEANALYLGQNEKAADSDKLDGRDSFYFAKGLDTWLLADFLRLGDGATHDLGHQVEGSYPGLSLELTCDTDGGTTLVATSQEPFYWWWDGASGEAFAGSPPYQQSFPMGSGVESNTLRTVFTRAWFTTTLELDSTVGFDPRVEANVCVLGWTLHKTANSSAGP